MFSLNKKEKELEFTKLEKKYKQQKKAGTK